MYNVLTKDIRVRDPYIVPYEGKYYLFGTTDTDPWDGKGEGFQTYVSEDMENWEGPLYAFQPGPDFWGEKNFWAPEVHRYKGSWYIFASFIGSGRRRGTQILKADCITGPYTPITEYAVTPADWECLDGTLHVDEEGNPWIVFCHEWVQIHDGEICAMPLSDDLREPVGEPVVLFRASEAPWEAWRDADHVTDGPFMFRGSDGMLKMIWSSFSKNGYAVGVATSKSGSVLGPWEQSVEPSVEGGGHGMIFTDYEGKTWLTFHSPNESPEERMHLIPFEK